MASKKIIALTDLDDKVCYFSEDSLLEQLSGANLPGTGPIKSAFRNLANRASEMRKTQGQYFTASHGTHEKSNLLRRSKELEKQVDDIIKNFNRVLEAL